MLGIMRISPAAAVAVLLIALASQGVLSGDPRPEGEACSSFYQSSRRGFGTRFEKATENGDLTCMKEFHNAGDDVDRWNRFGYASIHSTAFAGNIEALKLLIQFGADLNRVTQDGTALQIAACRGYLDYVKLLLSAGADKTLVDPNSETPLSKVCQCQSCDDATAKQLRDLLGGGCAIQSNTDYPSDNGILNNGKNDITSTNEECCQLCANNPRCKVWTRIKGTPGGSTVGECWLREFVPASKQCSWCDSGLNSCGVLVESDYPSTDGLLNDGKNTITSSNAECCKKCNENSECKAWTRIKWDTEYNKKGECWLRNYVPERKYCAHCDSGFKG